MLWRIIANAMVVYFVDIAKFTSLHPFLMDGFYWTIISMWIKPIHNSMDLPGIQNDLTDAKYASTSVWMWVWRVTDLACIRMCNFLAPWLSFVTNVLLMYEVYQPCLLFSVSHIPNRAKNFDSAW